MSKCKLKGKSEIPSLPRARFLLELLLLFAFYSSWLFGAWCTMKFLSFFKTKIALIDFNELIIK